jgi:hypothetical protein
MPTAPKKKKFTNPNNYPIYSYQVRGGVNPKNGRFYDINGRLSSKEKALASSVKREDYGGLVSKMSFPTPLSDALNSVEIMISPLAARDDSKSPGRGLANILQAAMTIAPTSDGKPQADIMPVAVQSRMRLAEHFYETTGDATSVCDVPVELLTRNLTVECPDNKLEQDIRDFIKEHGINKLVGELWSTVRTYGQAYPWCAWNSKGNDLEQIITLSPLHVHVGYNWGYSLSSLMVGENAWNKALMESRLPPAMYQPLVRHWDDHPLSPSSGFVNLSGENLYPIYDRKRGWQRYAIPMLARGFRDLASRVVYEDTMRGLIEGYKYQFWIFKVGDADHPPLPEEIAALKSALGGLNSERTGFLVWRDSPLTVEVKVPAGLDQMMGLTYHTDLTRSFFRAMGITPKVVAGEHPGGITGGGSSGKDDVDVLIYLERARYQAAQITDWITDLVGLWLDKSSTTGKKALKNTTISFGPIQFEQAQRIKDVLGPMYRDGALSWRTYMIQSGINPESELKNKKAEAKNRADGDFSPPVTFSQVATTAGGDQKTATQTEPQGSPTQDGEQRNKNTVTVKTPIKAEEEQDY